MYRYSSQSGTRILPKQETIDACLWETPVAQPRDQMSKTEIAQLGAVAKCFGRRRNAPSAPRRTRIIRRLKAQAFPI